LISNSGTQGEFAVTLDPNQIWPVASVGAPVVGETWFFTTWFRDGGGSSNFTDAISLTFQ
jgi:hypothetical protein